MSSPGFCSKQTKPFIKKTCPCKIHREFFSIKLENVFIFSICLLKTLIMAVQTRTHDICFGAKIRKICEPLHTPGFYIKVGYKGVYIIIQTCYPDVMFYGSENCPW